MGLFTDWLAKINEKAATQAGPLPEPMSNLEYILRTEAAARKWQESGGYPVEGYRNTLRGLDVLKQATQGKPPFTGSIANIVPMPHHGSLRKFYELFFGESFGAYNPRERTIEVRGDLSPYDAFASAFHEGAGHSPAYHPGFKAYGVRKALRGEHASDIVKQRYPYKPLDWPDETLALGLQELMSRKYWPDYRADESYLPQSREERELIEQYFKELGL